MLPQRATFLIVGGGPTGLTCAIALAKQGCQDIVLVDAVLQGHNCSRALAIHAATLEALDTIGCADPLVQLGVKGNEMGMRMGTNKIFSVEFSSIAKYTRFPFVLILPQNVTERVLGEQLQNLGAVRVFRPYKVIGMAANKSENVIDVTFETGETIQSRYVIGADGAKSIVRQMSGIGFADPDNESFENNFIQFLLADITLSSPPGILLPTNELSGFIGPNGISLFLPMPLESVTGPAFEALEGPPDTPVYRLICNIPIKDGPPPHAPPTSYVQTALNKYGPTHLSSDPSVNPHPVKVLQTVWSTRYRTHAAIADRFFVRFGTDAADAGSADNQSGGVVFLIGDAAHIHSPAGGQGMNLGIRDAVGLAAVLEQHLKLAEVHDGDKILQDYAVVRHARAVTIIRLTKRFQFIPVMLQSKIFKKLAHVFLWLVGRIPAVRKALAWRLSGLGTR